MKAVTTVEELESLDGDLMVAGYLAGFKSTPDYTRSDKAYWHGYMNGQVDGGYMPASTEQRQLAHAVVEQGRALA